MYEMNFRQVFRYQDALIEGVGTTLTLTLITATAGLIIGLVCGAGAQFGPRWVRRVVQGYVQIIRNTPVLIQLFIVFFALPKLGLRMPPFESACVAISIYFGAYSSEIVRAGLKSIHKTQIEAGACLGLTRWQVFRYVVLPPAMQNVYPALTSQFVLLMLGTSIASQVSAEELFHAGSFIESRTFRSFEVYALICAIYLALTLCFKLVFWLGERALFPQKRKLAER